MRFEAVLAQAEIASWVGAISTSSATIVGLGIAVWENSMTVISVSAHASTSVTTSGTVIRGHLHGEARLVRSADHFWEAGSAQRMVGQMCSGQVRALHEGRADGRGITRRRLDWMRRAPHRHVLSDRATDECFEVLASIDRTPSGAHPEGFAMPSPKMYPTPASASVILPIHTAARRHDRQAPYPHTVSAVKNYSPIAVRICGL
jgi:hypothetical protein